MTHLKTTNMLSSCFGPSPTAPYDVEDMKIKRGYIVYIEITSKKILRIRQFYCDYKNPYNGLYVSDQSDFEKQVIDLSSHPEINDPVKKDAFNRYFVKNPPSSPSTTPRPFPFIFCDNIDEVHFGNVPCHVTYIFNTPFFKFLNTASVPENRPKDNEQPMVLRSSKIIRDNAGKFIEKNYGYPNDTFFNLEVDNRNSSTNSLMRFDNIMYGCSEKYSKEYCMDIYFDAPTDKWKGEFSNLLRNFIEKLKIDNPKFSEFVENDCEKSLEDSIGEFSESLFDSLPKRSGKSKTPTNWVTMVFDPPQTNGGTGGPPN